MPVSIPEKTLEHWASIYLVYRYRSKVNLWWPTQGQDIDVQALPLRPGKAVQVELKTATPVSGGLGHEVRIDIHQLLRYRAKPLHQQPFYVFPLPPWSGDLSTAAAGWGLPPSELAFSRAGQGKWFAQWLHVLTAAEVEAVVRPLTSTSGPRHVPLVTFTPPGGPTVWGRGAAAPPSPTRWRDFWWTLERCGLPRWPQLIRLPKRLATEVSKGSGLSYVQALQEAADPDARWEPADLVTLGPGVNGGFKRVKIPAFQGEDDQDSEDESVGDNRQIVFMDADIWKSMKLPED